MSDTTTPTHKIILPDADAIAEMRTKIRAEQRRIYSACHDAVTPRDAGYLGMLSEALDTASDAVFNVLNVAFSYCGCEAAQIAIHNLHHPEAPRHLGDNDDEAGAV